MTSVYSLGTSDSDVQNLSDVQRPSTLLEKFYFQIMGQVKSGYTEIMDYIIQDKDIGDDISFEYQLVYDKKHNRTKYSDYKWYSYPYNNPFDTYVHKVFCETTEFELKCTFMSMFKNEKWFKQGISKNMNTSTLLNDDVFGLIKDYSETKRVGVSITSMETTTSDNLKEYINSSLKECPNNNKISEVILTTYLNHLKVQIEEWYKVFTLSLPMSEDVRDGRVKIRFTLTDEQRDDMWQTIVRQPSLNGDNKHYKNFLLEHTENCCWTRVRWDNDRSEVLHSVLMMIYMKSEYSSMNVIVNSVIQQDCV